jgi:hypothetical protein
MLDAVRTTADVEGLHADELAEGVTTKMKTFLPTDDLLFLARPSVEPLHQRRSRQRVAP